MASVTYPAREYSSAVPLLLIERGGYKRYIGSGAAVWYFKLPDGSKIIEVDDAMVPTINLKPVITLGNWHLDRVIWTRIKPGNTP